MMRFARLDPQKGLDLEFVKPDQRASSCRRATGSLLPLFLAIVLVIVRCQDVTPDFRHPRYT